MVFVAVSSTVAAGLAWSGRRRCRGCVLGLPRSLAAVDRRARPVGLHQPRDRLLAAAGRGARADLPAGVGRQRRDLRGGHGLPRRRRAPGAHGASWLGNFIGSTVVLLGLWWHERDGGSRAGARRGPCRSARRRCRCGGCWPSACRRSPSTPASTPSRSSTAPTCFRADSPAAAGLYAVAVKLGDRRLRRGARLPVRVAAAGLLGRRRRRGRAGCTRWSPPTTSWRPASSWPASRCSAAGSCGSCCAGRYFYGPHVALPWLALGWALYGLYLVFVVIAGRARMMIRNLPAAAARPRRQRRRARPARPAARHRRRRDRALRGLRGDARGDLRADPPALQRRLRVGPPGASRGRARRASARGRRAACCRRSG